MLYIYGALALGGVETFFVRMAKERAIKGMPTKILLLARPQRSNAELLAEMARYADIYFVEDVFSGVRFLARHFPLVAPVKNESVRDLFNNISQVHVYGGMHALLAYRLRAIVDADIPITVGFYHYITYVWGGDDVAYCERVNRQFVFCYLPAENLAFFSQGNRDFHAKHRNVDLENAGTFRLGVVDARSVDVDGGNHTPVKICSVGRLVAFKTYNLYMLDVVKRLINGGFEVVFDVYGDGPLRDVMEAKIRELDLFGCVRLKGRMDYSKFDETVSDYDCFIGSGTAVIQAASLGVPSIAAVENVVQPRTYGFFNNVHQYEYNLSGLNLPLYDVYNLIVDYIGMTTEQRMELQKDHLRSVGEFTNALCQENMDALKQNPMPTEEFKFNRWLYEFSRLFDWISKKIKKNHPYNTRYKDFSR